MDAHSTFVLSENLGAYPFRLVLEAYSYDSLYTEVASHVARFLGSWDAEQMGLSSTNAVV